MSLASGNNSFGIISCTILQGSRQNALNAGRQPIFQVGARRYGIYVNKKVGQPMLTSVVLFEKVVSHFYACS